MRYLVIFIKKEVLDKFKIYTFGGKYPYWDIYCK
jgi:hypothetical protein